MEKNTWTEYKSKIEKEDPELIKRMERNTKYSLRIERAISNRGCKGDAEDIPSILQDFEDEIRQENAQSNKRMAEKFYQSFIDELMRGCGDDKEFWVVKLINKKAKQLGVEIKE